MLKRLIQFSLDNASLVLVLACAIVALASFQLPRMPVDVFPELNAPTVVVMVEAPGLAAEVFKTFCIEYNEYISLGGTYEASINAGAIQGGLSGGVGGIDYISNATKWFYSAYRNNTLGITGFLYDNNAAADALQLIFWRLEGEVEQTTWKATGKTSLLGTSSIRSIADSLWDYYIDNKNDVLAIHDSYSAEYNVSLLNRGTRATKRE